MSAKQKSVVVISTARELDYQLDYVSLPREYGTAAFDQREDIRAIRETVFANLTTLDQKIHFTEKIINRKVLIKPNLVTVFHDLGMHERDYPESTDPRVLDSVVLFIQQFTRDIQIVESAGKGIPTRAAFRIAGLDRLAKVRGVELIALEEKPVERYLLPRAKVMREMIIPRTFTPVIYGEAFYISLPKMKTNLYSQVTLGFKNAMGTIPYFLRLRNHNHALDEKLVDMMRLFQADLVIIDGIVGGEGNAPAPVNPVPSRVIISGNNSVETDRVATRMMGIDPASVPLLRIADQEGFNDPRVEILGEETVTHFKQADPSLMGDWMQEHFPNVRVLVGDHRAGVLPEVSDSRLDPQDVVRMEMVCRGGCLASARYAFDMLHHEGQRKDFHLTMIIGPGLEVNGESLWYDRQGKPFRASEIGNLPGRKMAVGSCTSPLKHLVEKWIEGCMPFPNSAHMVVHQLSGTWCSVLRPRNRFLFSALLDTLRLCETRKKLLRSGERIDILWQPEDRFFDTRKLSPEECELDFIVEPYLPLTRAEIRRLCSAENRSILATFFP